MTEIKKWDEVVDRLLANGFNFRIEGNKLILPSCPNKEVSPYVLGFSYYGKTSDFVYDMTSKDDISDIIYDSFAKYKRCVERYIKRVVDDVIERL